MAQISNAFIKGHEREYSSGQILLYQGEKSTDVLIVNSGYVKVYDVDAKGNEKVLLILSKGDMFPLIWTFGASDSLMYFYETLSDSVVSAISRKDFMRHINESHEFTVLLLQYFVARTKELMTRVESIEGTSALHKVGQVLQYLAATHATKIAKNTKKLKLIITHQLIAQMSGLTRETVSLQMKIFEDGKSIDKSEEYLIVHTDRIENLLNTGS